MEGHGKGLCPGKPDASQQQKQRIDGQKRHEQHAHKGIDHKAQNGKGMEQLHHGQAEPGCGGKGDHHMFAKPGVGKGIEALLQPGQEYENAQHGTEGQLKAGGEEGKGLPQQDDQESGGYNGGPIPAPARNGTIP